MIQCTVLPYWVCNQLYSLFLWRRWRKMCILKMNVWLKFRSYALHIYIFPFFFFSDYVPSFFTWESYFLPPMYRWSVSLSQQPWLQRGYKTGALKREPRHWRQKACGAEAVTAASRTRSLWVFYWHPGATLIVRSLETSLFTFSGIVCTALYAEILYAVPSL